MARQLVLKEIILKKKRSFKEELNEIKQLKQHAAIKRCALEFQNKLASLTFLDPAAGSGNFLTETYIALRELENEALVLIHGDNVLLDTESDLIKVSLDQFYGIEVNDFAVSVAKTALWIAESQMFEKTKDLIYSEADFLPIKSYPNIVEGNALTMNWVEVVDPRDLDFIIGNPPFIGARKMSSQQSSELKEVFNNRSGVGNLDYVTSWFYKASEFIQDTSIEVSFVSTNSITQGQQVALLWDPLINNLNLVINFAYRTFKWQNEASDSAAVHCVIIGFANFSRQNKIIYDGESMMKVNRINPYLIDGSNTTIKSLSKPLSNVPKMIFGSMPNDGGHLLLTKTEKEALITKDPHSEKYIKKLYGAAEFINNRERYCLWLKDITPNELKSMPYVFKRVAKVKENRLNSKRKATRYLADTPHLFGEIRQPDTNYLLVPAVSSENRRYIPIGFMSKEDIATNRVYVIPDATLYDFGIMTSNVHMAWMRTVAGRLELRYNYSATVVYNTFPWPKLNEKQKNKIEKAAQSILDARALYPESTLSDLYDEISMPVELRKAHQENDKSVMEAYGMKVGETTESDSVTQLFKMYEKLVTSK